MTQVRALIALMRLDRPVGFWLLLWPTLAALTYGARQAGLGFDGMVPLYGVFIAGTLLMRSAGCVLNDLLDADFDKHVARTQNRPLAAGTISVRVAWGLLGVLLALSAMLLMFLPARVTLFALGALPLVAAYPLMKRWTSAAQVFLGITFNWGIWVAWAATQPLGDWSVWPLFLASACWTIGYDTFYAVSDAPDDAKLGLKSTAVFFGAHVREAVAVFYGLACVFLWLLDGGLWYHLGVLGVAAILSAQILQTAPQDPASAFASFKACQWVGVLWWLLMFLTGTGA